MDVNRKQHKLESRPTPGEHEKKPTIERRPPVCSDNPEAKLPPRHGEKRKHVKGINETLEQRIIRLRRQRQEYKRRQLEALEVVPNAPFRERFLKLQEQGDISTRDICQVMGWMRRRNAQSESRDHPDGKWLQRKLGIIPDLPKPGALTTPDPRDTIPYEEAVKLADIMGMDYHEAGV
jgi:hypothetical protein